MGDKEQLCLRCAPLPGLRRGRNSLSSSNARLQLRRLPVKYVQESFCSINSQNSVTDNACQSRTITSNQQNNAQLA